MLALFHATSPSTSHITLLAGPASPARPSPASLDTRQDMCLQEGLSPNGWARRTETLSCIVLCQFWWVFFFFCSL